MMFCGENASGSFAPKLSAAMQQVIMTAFYFCILMLRVFIRMVAVDDGHAMRFPLAEGMAL